MATRPTAYTKETQNPTNWTPQGTNATNWNPGLSATGGLLLSSGGLLELSDGNTLGIIVF